MRTKFGEVFYKTESQNEISVYRHITLSNEKNPIVYLMNMETDAVGHILDSDLASNSELSCIIPKYTLRVIYIGSKADDFGEEHNGYIVAMAPVVDTNKGLFEPFYVADFLDEDAIEDLNPGDTVFEMKLYPWETFETIRRLLWKTPIRYDILHAHECNTAKRHPKFPIKTEPDVPVKIHEFIDLILTAIDKDMDVIQLYDTRIDPVTKALYEKGGPKSVRFYREIEKFITNTVISAYGVKLDITIIPEKIQKKEYFLVRLGDRGEIYVVPYTSGYEQYKVNYVNGDKETQDELDFLYKSIGRKNPKERKSEDSSFTYAGV